MSRDLQRPSVLCGEPWGRPESSWVADAMIQADNSINDSVHWTTQQLPSMRSLNLGLFRQHIQAARPSLFQEECLSSLSPACLRCHLSFLLLYTYCMPLRCVT